MTDRPRFVDELRSQLQDGAVRLAVRRRRQRVGAVAALVAVLVAGGLGVQLLAGQDEGRIEAADHLSDEAGRSEPQSSVTCLAALPDQQSSGLVSVPLASVFDQGFRGGFLPQGTVFAELHDPVLEEPWFAVLTVVTDAGARPLGVAAWILPDSVVVYGGSGTGERTDPLVEPGTWHLFAWSELAVESSIWERVERFGLSIDPEQVVRECMPGGADGVDFVSGSLGEGRSWVVAGTESLGLCLSIGAEDRGCRGASEFRNGSVAQAEEGLLYGRLPDEAVAVEIIAGGQTLAPRVVVVDPKTGLWAATVAAEARPIEVIYLNSENAVIGTGDVS